jgi:hypothetical protein
MVRKTKLLLFITVLILCFYGFSEEYNKKSTLSKIATNDDAEFIAVNECFMWIANNGMGSHNPITDGSGFYWPGGENATIPAIFADGLLWGANVEGEIRVNGSTYRYGLQAGKILDVFSADDPNDPRYRIYKIRKNWEELPDGPSRRDYEKDYNEWPVQDGAPWVDINSDGVYTKGIDEPEFLGDEMLWCVSNDLDSSRTTFTYGKLPIGLEVHTLVFGFKNTGDLGNMLFKKYKIINKGDFILEDMYLAYWSDSDLGFASDDFSGCDTLLNLGYTYNADNFDESNNDRKGYGENPPAAGYALLQGPIVPYNPQDSTIQLFNLPDSAKFNNEWRNNSSNLPMTSFTFSINSYFNHPTPTSQSISLYNLMKGRLYSGDPFIDPITDEIVTRILSGDPVNGTGWYEGDGWPNGPQPGDRRHMMGSGPFTMVPGDTQEVVIGIVIARGSDNIQSIAELKKSTEKAIILSNNNFVTVPDVPIPEVKYYTENKNITLYWEPEVEDYDEIDKLVQIDGYEDVTYTFEGYILRQYSDVNGSNEKIIASFDIINNVDELLVKKRSREYIYEELFYELDNKGIERKITIERDSIKETSLNNNSPYYYSLSAIVVNENSEPIFIESKRNIIEVFPGSTPTDIDDKGYKPTDYLVPILLDGHTNAEIKFNIVDPLALTGDTYQITFAENDIDQLSYSLLNVTKDEYLLNNLTDIIYQGLDDYNQPYLANTGDKFVLDGFTLDIRDLGAETIAHYGSKYAVLDVLEVKGPDGLVLDEPVSVDNKKLNSTKEWSVFAQGLNNRYNWQASRTREGLGYDFYEIRFTSLGSDYFASGYNIGTLNSIPTKDDAKGEGKVPFEIWNIGQTFDDASDDIRLIVKILDNNLSFPDFAINDNQWSQLPSGNWEEIYAFEDSVMDADNLPSQSGRSEYTSHKFGAFVISGSLPKEGTVIRIVPALPLNVENVFEITMPQADLNSKENVKKQLNSISVFPNPYLGSNNLQQTIYDRFVRFINLPRTADIRIFNLGGAFIQKIKKDSNNDFVDWDLRNKHGVLIASGLYLAYIEIPGVGTKILKLVVIQGEK